MEKHYSNPCMECSFEKDCTDYVQAHCPAWKEWVEYFNREIRPEIELAKRHSEERKREAEEKLQKLMNAAEEAYHELRVRCGYKPGYHAYDALAEVLKDFQDIKEYFLRE